LQWLRELQSAMIRRGFRNFHRVSLEIVLGGTTYIYTFSFERRMEEHGDEPRKITSHLLESLSLVEDGSPPVALVTRENEDVRVNGQPNRNPIRIGMPTPMLSAMKALLPPEDELLSHVDAVFGFLDAVRYYGVEAGGAPVGTGSISIVRGEDYRKWLEQSGAMDDANQPTVMRLLRLFQEDPDRFHELEKLVGERLGVIDRIFVTTLSHLDGVGESKHPRYLFVRLCSHAYHHLRRA